MEDKLYWYKGKCTRVVDGDTFDISFSMGLDLYLEKRVRLYGIDTPETYGVKKGSEEYIAGKKATARAIELVTDVDLWIKTIKDKTGKYGRYLVEVYKEINGEYICINDLLVTEGLAERKSY